MQRTRCSWLRQAGIVVGASCVMATATAATDDGEAAFRELYRELIEINTTLSAGSCTAAADAPD